MKMRQSALIFAVLVTQIYAAPQFITFQDGKLGVNFGGYHAGVGLGGLLGGGAGGGLFAEAGTPYGQAAKAGLGGAVESNGRAAGGLYAGATAGGNIKAEAGLGGKVASSDTSGAGFATAQAGGYHASSGLGGETSAGGSSGVLFSATKSIHVPKTVVKEVVVPVETVKQTKAHTELNFDVYNEVKPVANAEVEVKAGAGAHATAQPAVIVKEVHTQPEVIVKEVYVERPTKVIEKHIVHTHTKPRHREFHKTAYIGGFIGAGAEAPSSVYKSSQPTIEKRIDVGTQGSVNAGVDTAASANGGGQVTYTKEVTVSRNPNFFQDIFNIPISALKAVSGFLSNTAASTSVSVQKSATVQAGAHI